MNAQIERDKSLLESHLESAEQALADVEAAYVAAAKEKGYLN